MQYLHRRILITRASAAALLMVSAFTGSLAAEDPAVVHDSSGGGVIQAIWLPRETSFEFNSERTSYTCESFKEKVRSVLVAVGVHPSLIVHLRCGVAAAPPSGRPRGASKIKGEAEGPTVGPTHISGTSSQISTRITLAVPVVANDQNIRDATTFDARRLLLAKMTQAEVPTPSTIPVFPAAWTFIRVNSKTIPRLEAVDCELLRQLSQQVLPIIGVKVTRKLMCWGAKISKPTFEVEALVPVSYAPPSGP